MFTFKKNIASILFLFLIAMNLSILCMDISAKKKNYDESPFTNYQELDSYNSIGSSNFDYSRFSITNFERKRQIALDLKKFPDCQCIFVLNNLFPKTLNLLDKKDFLNISEILEVPEYEELPKIQEVKVTEDSLNNPKFNSEINDPNFDEENRYVKCNIEDCTGWVNLNIVNLIKKIQRPVHTESTNKPQFIPYTNKVILHGPPGNGKTTIVEKIAELSDAHLIKITGSSLHSEYVNHGAKKIQEYFAQALFYAGSHKYKKIIIFIDEADSFAKYDPSTNQNGNFQLATTQELWQYLDKIRFEQQIFVILATNNYKRLHPTLTSRFNNNIIKLSNPTQALREEIINYYLKIFEISLFKNEIDKMVTETEGMGIRDIELLFISAYERINSVNIETDEILKKGKPNLLKIIDSRLKEAILELEKRKKNEEAENREEEIKINNLIIQRNQIENNKKAELVEVTSSIGGIIGGSIGLVTGVATGLVTKGPYEAFKEGAKGAASGATIGGGLGYSIGYIYYKGWISKTFNYAKTNMNPLSKKIISVLSFGILLKKISINLTSSEMIKSKL